MYSSWVMTVLLSLLIFSCSSSVPQPAETVLVTVIVTQPPVVITATPQPAEVISTHTNTPVPLPSATTTAAATPGPFLCGNVNAINWDKVNKFVGEEITVFGQVVDTHYASSTNSQPTFLNIGKPYPDPERFTVLFWGQNRDSFPPSPEDYYLEQYICVTGVVELYEGVVEMEIRELSQIFIP